jgi:hypothetical protein
MGRQGPCLPAKAVREAPWAQWGPAGTSLYIYRGQQEVVTEELRLKNKQCCKAEKQGEGIPGKGNSICKGREL